MDDENKLDDATKQATLSAIRLILVTIGGSATTLGLLTAQQVQLWVTIGTTVTGALLVVIPAAYGVWVSFHKVKRADEREAVALNAGIQLSNQSSSMTPHVPKEEVKEVIAAVTSST